MAAPQNRSNVPIGTVLGEKFRITQEIGRGGMAAVYEAENIHIGKRVAVKILNAELVTSRIVRERFLREARAAAAIRSPYICDVYDSGMYDGRPFLVMELLEGESLYDLMTRVRQLDPVLTLRVADHSCRGLQKAHEASVIHRDLKPENIFLTKNEEGETVAKILDFGLAKFYEPTEADAAQVRLTREGALFGTPAYMSPEQAKGRGDVDHRADLWALGCIVYECLTGQTVWNVDQGVAMILAQIAGAPIPKPTKLRPDLPASFNAWFLKALERDPAKRFQNAKDFAEGLAEAFAGQKLPAPPRSSAPSEEEGQLIDELVNQSHAAIQLPAGAPPTASGSLSRDPVDPGPSDVLVVQPTPSRSPLRVFWVLLAIAAVAVGGYALWFYVLKKPPLPIAQPRASAPVSGDAGAPDAAVAPKLEPQEKEPYALQIASAQQWLSKGGSENALKMFKEAFNNGGTGVARSLLNQAAVALPKSDGACRLTGLARPRPYDITVMSSRPTLALTPNGPVVAWVDNHQDKTRRQAFTTQLDNSLRRVSPVRVVTPESESVRHPQLLSAGDKLALIYWDGAGKEPGVYIRMLGADGRIASQAQRLSGVRRHEFYPALARLEDGGFWAVWEERIKTGTDLMGRRIKADGTPAGEPVRLAIMAPTRLGESDVSKPDISIHDDRLNVVFAVERGKKRGKKQQILLLSVPLNDADLKTGVQDDKKRRRKRKDIHVGRLTAVSKSHGKNAQPRIACGASGCFVVWDDEGGGALAAFVDKAKGESLWHREFSRGGARPAVGVAPDGAIVAWYEKSRVRVAKMTRDGVEKPSTLARVGGYQPYPAIVAGAEQGEWYVSWRDYEAGHLESFVIRAKCQ